MEPSIGKQRPGESMKRMLFVKLFGTQFFANSPNFNPTKKEST